MTYEAAHIATARRWVSRHHAGGKAVSLRKDVHTAAFSVTLSVTPDAEAAGRRVVELVRDACARDDAKLLSSLERLFPDVVWRTPELHALMDQVCRDNRDDLWRTILRAPGKRGPKAADEFDLVALIERVRQEENIDEAKAAIERLIEIFGEERDKPSSPDSREMPFLPGLKALRNRHSSLHALFRLWCHGIFVPGELLTARPWLPPGYQPPPPLELVATKLSSCVVYHSPDSRVTEPDREGATDHVEDATRSAE